MFGMHAKKRVHMEPPFPKVWYRPDSVIINPSICDTIDLPNSYTMIVVYESFQQTSSQQLWKINRTDNKYYSERYRFTGKERDSESGYDYFGARYYSSTLPMWLSVDPLSDKYPELSPYAYCAWNPMKFVDPDGRKVFFAQGVSDSFKQDFQLAVKYMNQHKISDMLYQLEKSQNVYYIAEGEQLKSSSYYPKTRTITWSSRTGYITDILYEMSPVEVLNHEIDHALQHDLNPKQQLEDYDKKNDQYGNEEEKRVIKGSEQVTAKKLDKLKDDEVTRLNHDGSPYETTSPISNEDIGFYNY